MHARDPAGLQRASASSIDSAGGLAHHEVHPAAEYDPLTTGELGDAEPEAEESEARRPAVDKAALQQHLSLEAARWGQRMTSELDNALSVAGEAGVACWVQQCKWGGLQFLLVHWGRHAVLCHYGGAAMKTWTLERYHRPEKGLWQPVTGVSCSLKEPVIASG